MSEGVQRHVASSASRSAVPRSPVSAWTTTASRPSASICAAHPIRTVTVGVVAPDDVGSGVGERHRIARPIPFDTPVTTALCHQRVAVPRGRFVWRHHTVLLVLLLPGSHRHGFVQQRQQFTAVEGFDDDIGLDEIGQFTIPPPRPPRSCRRRTWCVLRATASSWARQCVGASPQRPRRRVLRRRPAPAFRSGSRHRSPWRDNNPPRPVTSSISSKRSR